MLAMLESWELHTTGCVLNGSTVAACMFTASLGLQMASTDNRDEHLEELIQYINKTISPINPAVQCDGSDVDSAPHPKTNPHICNKAYADVMVLNGDLSDLIATYQ